MLSSLGQVGLPFPVLSSTGIGRKQNAKSAPKLFSSKLTSPMLSHLHDDTTGDANPQDGGVIPQTVVCSVLGLRDVPILHRSSM